MDGAISFLFFCYLFEIVQMCKICAIINKLYLIIETKVKHCIFIFTFYFVHKDEYKLVYNSTR